MSQSILKNFDFYGAMEAVLFWASNLSGVIDVQDLSLRTLTIE